MAGLKATGWSGRVGAIAVHCAALLGMLALLLSLSGVALGGEAPAGKQNPLDQPMIFSIVRSAAGYCEPNCPEWIYGEGQIVARTPEAFRKILKKAGERRLPLLIVSPGGNVMAAIEMGRMVRKRGMDVEVSATRFVGCSPRDTGCKPDGAAEGEYRGAAFSAGAFCWSACPLVLAAGERRLSSQWSHTGVHQITTVYERERVYFRERFRYVDGKKKVISRKVVSRKKAGTKTSTKLPKSTRRALVAYFKDMGIRQTLLDAMLSTTPDKIRKLEPEEMLGMHLITEVTATGLLADPLSCTGRDRPGNCIARNPEPLTKAVPQAPPPHRI